ncbi:hypothetical protein AX17_003949 [Amanita inopinata Kibby_2008]|nr:hypothetical protein AX17_003949 [Amanita inopinata Kibby_2008]
MIPCIGESGYFGGGGLPVTPLSFDTANQNLPVTSPLFIFRFPIELLSHILPYFDRDDLASLALVDRDCRQLARSVQFAKVTIFGKVYSINLLADLLREADVRAKSPNTPFPSIGACIRKLVINENFYDDEVLRGLNYALGLDIAQSMCRTIRHAMPNLHILDWNRRASLSFDDVNRVLQSPVKHIRLKGIKIKGPCPDFTSLPMPTYETVSMYLPDADPNGTTPDTSMLCLHILRSSASTLRGLILEGETTRLAPIFTDDTRFPNIRSLVLRSRHNCDTLLQNILGSNTCTRNLTLNSADPTVREFIRCRGYISTLESFHLLNEDIGTGDHFLAFLNANTHLTTVEISEPLLSSILDGRLLPMLKNNFHCLSSLHINWARDVISEESLRLLSKITTLKHLWISAGQLLGWFRMHWTVDHNSILDALKPLQHLEKLTFTDETYTTEVHPLTNPDPGKYYHTKAIPSTVQTSEYLTRDEQLELYETLDTANVDLLFALRDRMRVLVWERWHRGRMAAIASTYAKIFPKLRSCFVGQLFFGIVDGCVSCESKKRDSFSEIVAVKWRL